MTRSTPKKIQTSPGIKTLCLGLFLVTWGLKPAIGGISEYGVKAAYLYNFTQFVQWPKGAFTSETSPMVIGVLGTDPFGGALEDAVKDKTSGGHPLAVKHLGAFNPGNAALGKCQVLFIAYSEKDNLGSILKALSTTRTLTVSEIENFPVKGGAIQFDQEGQKITLVLNENAAKKMGLSISSQLLQVAKLYQP